MYLKKTVNFIFLKLILYMIFNLFMIIIRNPKHNLKYLELSVKQYIAVLVFLYLNIT